MLGAQYWWLGARDTPLRAQLLSETITHYRFRLHAFLVNDGRKRLANQALQET